MTTGDWEIIAPMIVAIVMFLTVGGVILLRPLSRRLGDLLEAMARERTEGLPRVEDQLGTMRDLLEAQGERIALLEERVDFTEALVGGEERRRLAGGDDPGSGRAGS